MNPTNHQLNDLTYKVNGCAMEVHRELGPGFNESVYKNAFAHELKLQGLTIEIEKRINVHYKETIVGEFSADIFVERCLIIELKAVQALLDIHEAQLVNYLTATKVDVGLLINFGSSSLQTKKKFRIYKDTSNPENDPPRLQG